MKKDQNGFSTVEGLLVGVIIAMITGVGYFVYKADQSSNKQQADSSVSQQEKSTNDQAKDPTEGWKSYKDKDGLFSLKYPSSWTIAENLDMCDPGLVLLGANKESTGACQSDNGGQISVEARKGDLLRSDYELLPEYYSDIKTESITINGVASMKQLGTFSPNEEVFLGPKKGDKKLIYIFQDGGYTYAASYYIKKDNPYPDVQSDFELMITKTLKFKE